MQKFVFGLCLAVLLLCGPASCGNKEEWKKRTVYQIITDRFNRGNGDVSSPCDLHNYCGGDHLGITKKLQYIKDLGFDAIWISPVVDNVEGSYHGYGARNWELLNSHFGDEKALHTMIDSAHKLGIWVMLDVVANHVGPVNDFSEIYPLNRPEHYHTRCEITDWNNQWQMENCWLFTLPDLNQDHPWVRKYLQDWVKWVITKYNFDGIRVDTVPHVAKPFWKEYGQAAGVYQIGEVYNGDDGVLAEYQKYMDGLLNYPMFFTMRSVFASGNSMRQIGERFRYAPGVYPDYEALGMFVDNHDQGRFLSVNGEIKLFKAAIGFALTSRGIPIMYYGSEQGFAGGTDPANREAMWNNFDTNHPMYQFVKKVNEARRSSGAVAGTFTEKWADDNLYAYRKGGMFVACTNKVNMDISINVPNVEYADGTKLCNVFNPSDCVTVSQATIPVRISNGDFKIYLPSSNSVFTTPNPSISAFLLKP